MRMRLKMETIHTAARPTHPASSTLSTISLTKTPSLCASFRTNFPTSWFRQAAQSMRPRESKAQTAGQSGVVLNPWPSAESVDESSSFRPCAAMEELDSGIAAVDAAEGLYTRLNRTDTSISSSSTGVWLSVSNHTRTSQHTPYRISCY
jgi:hypothetical protein